MILDKAIEMARIILNVLNRENYCRTDIMKLTIRYIGSPDKFNRIFEFLVKKGYIVKLGEPRSRTPYAITDLGKEQLEIWEVKNHS